MSRFILCLTCVLFLGSSAATAYSQSYIFAGEGNGLDVITHSSGYTGVGGVLQVTVGIDPTSANAADMVISTQNVINTWNALIATTGNVTTGLPSSNLYDFESVLLHEMGHSIGLGHVNRGGGGGNSEYTYASDGADNTFSNNAGADGVIGTSDDIRGDDDNLTYFQIGVNNPFALPASDIIDSTTYSRDLADLPAGHTFSANGSRDVATLLGVANTEGVMQQGTFNNEIQRTLAPQDYAGIRYAQTGLDELQGTADDYILELVYSGFDDTADIVIDFDDAQTGFAVSQSSGAFIGGTDHIRITDNQIYFDPDAVNWYFNTQSNAAVPEPGTCLFGIAMLGLICSRRRRA